MSPSARPTSLTIRRWERRKQRRRLATSRPCPRPSVVIRLLRTSSNQKLGESERFLTEARKLAQLRHPGIVTVHDIGMHEGQVYIVSDYLDGPDLGHWLQGNRPSWSEAARITAAVADALGHAHARL